MALSRIGFDGRSLIASQESSYAAADLPACRRWSSPLGGGGYRELLEFRLQAAGRLRARSKPSDARRLKPELQHRLKPELQQFA